MSYTVRSASPEDASAIGNVHVAAWEAAYRGTLADSVLDSFTPDGKAVEWRAYLEREIVATERLWVLIDPGERVAGYCRTGPARDKDLEAEITAEVYGLYVHPDHWGAGAGKLLFGWAVDDFVHRAFFQASLWVVDSNDRARRFYESSGWRLDPGPTNTCFGAPEVRYRRSL